MLSINENGATIQGNGGRIILKRVRPAGGEKMTSQEWAEAEGVVPGQKLGV